MREAFDVGRSHQSGVVFRQGQKHTDGLRGIL